MPSLVSTSLLQERISVSLRLSSLVGCFAATYFFVHGDELAMKLFHLEENRGYVKILAPIFIFIIFKALYTPSYRRLVRQELP